MTLTARTTKGFERCGSVDGSAPLNMDFVLDNATAMTSGNLVALNGNVGFSATTSIGKVISAAAGTLYLGVAQEAFTTTTNPTASETMCKVDVNSNSFYRVTFAGHTDFTADAGTTTTVVDTDLADTANAYIGGTIYCYEGNNTGETRLVDEYDDSTTLTVTKAYSIATGTTDKFIVLGGDLSAYDGVHPGSYVVANTTSSAAIAIASCVGDAASGAILCVAVHPDDLMMVVKLITHRFNAAS